MTSNYEEISHQGLARRWKNNFQTSVCVQAIVVNVVLVFAFQKLLHLSHAQQDALSTVVDTG